MDGTPRGAAPALDTVSVVGVGLIGGSFALALRKAGFTGRIIGVSSPGTIKKALARGVVDEGLPLAQAAASAGLVYLSQPIRGILDTLPLLDAHLRSGALVTDAGSTKQVIAARAAATIHAGRFVGGHPMAGKESRGVDHAEADLFRGRPYVLTGREPLLEFWVERIGARLVILDPAEHDRLVALASHVPQLLSTALASLIGEHPDAADVAGPAAVDITRLALSPYEIWRDILATNAEGIEGALDLLIDRLRLLQSQLRSPEMERAFEQAAAGARELRNPRPR